MRGAVVLCDGERVRWTTVLHARKIAARTGGARDGGAPTAVPPFPITTSRKPHPMTVRNGRELLAIPGPTTVPDEVLSAMHRPAVDLYSGEIIQVTMSCISDLKKVIRTKSEPFLYAANGHGAWEAALVNCLSRGDRVLALQSGMFGGAWAEMASVLGLEVELFAAQPRRAIDPDSVRERLRADREGRIKAILAVQIDTAAGIVNDIPAIRQAVTDAGHPALVMVDTIASLACMPFEMDAWDIDVTVAGSQKGLMSPPGLAFVAAGERARAAHRRADLVTRYWDWSFREGDEHYQKYCGTAPEHLMFGLRRALDMLLDEGLERVFHRHALLADATRAAVRRWAEGGALGFNVLEPSERSNSVTTLRFDEYDPQRVLDFCLEHCGVVLGIGIGPELSGRAIRIAHMGHVNAPMTLGVLGTFESALLALGIPHGKGGVAEAAASLGAALAGGSAVQARKVA